MKAILDFILGLLQRQFGQGFLLGICIGLLGVFALYINYSVTIPPIQNCLLVYPRLMHS